MKLKPLFIKRAVLTRYLYIATCMAVPYAHGQATSKRKVDYGTAVEEFVKQGFPDIRGEEIRYVKINDQNLKWGQDGFSFERVDELKKLTGNGFLIPSKDSKTPDRFVFMGGSELFYLKKGSKATKHMDSDQLVRGALKEADIKKDLKKIQKWALTASQDSSFSYRGTDSYAVALGYTTLAYQMGYKEEANELFKTLFLNHSDPEAFIDRLINSLAEKEYESVYSSFLEAANWEQYHQELVRLYEKYPRGWVNQPALEILIPKVKERVDKIIPSTPKIEGHEFTPEVQKLVNATAVYNPKAEEQYGNQLFLITPLEKNSKASAFGQLKQHGMDGLLGIIALLGDTTLVTESSSSSHYSSSYYHSGSDEQTSAEEAYESIDRPSTRGELSEGILKSVLPHNRNLLSNMDEDALKRFALKWWEEHRNDSKIELTKHYLELGNDNHVYSIMNELLTQDTAESREMFENTILTTSDHDRYVRLAQSYVKNRRFNAKEFLDKYEELLVKEVGEDPEDNYYQVKNLGGTEKFIASLRKFTVEIKPDEILLKLADSEVSIAEQMDLLKVYYKENDVSGKVDEFIALANNKETLEEKFAVLSGLSEIMYGEESEYDESVFDINVYGSFDGIPSGIAVTDDKNEPEKQAEPRKLDLTSEQRKNWENLLFSQEYFESTKLSYLSGIILDKYIHSDRTRSEYEQCEALWGHPLFELVESRSRAMLDGEKLIPLPSYDLVSEERVNELTKEFTTVNASELRNYVESLNLSERLIIFDHDDYHSLLNRSRAYILGISEANNKLGFDDVTSVNSLFDSFIGLEINAESNKQCAQLVLENLNTFAGYGVTLSGYSRNPGKEVLIYKTPALKSSKIIKANEAVMAGTQKPYIAAVSYSNRNEEEEVVIFTQDNLPTNEAFKVLEDSPYLTVFAFNKATIEKLAKERAAMQNERGPLLDELMELNPDLEEYRAQFETMPLEQLKEYIEQAKL